VKASNPGVNQAFALGPWASLTLLALIIAYFVVLGRTGGTVFQRLFGMNELAVRVSGRLERGRSPDLPQPEQYELVL
jgi:hypothetical protein